MANPDRSLEALLDLDGQTFVIDEAGHFVKFQVRRVEASEHRPHGIDYSLTLHDRTGKRLLGFDNAHAVRRPGGRFVEQVRIYDHLHRGPDDPGRPYTFVSAGKLVEDFWAHVQRMLRQLEDN